MRVGGSNSRLCRSELRGIHMKNKILVFFLAAVMLAAAVMCAACSNTSGGETTTPAATAEPSTEPTPESTAVTPNIPDTVNFNNTVVNVLICKEQKKQTVATEDSDGLLADALTARLARVEEKLGIKFEFIESPGNWSNRADFIHKVEVAVQNGSEYDLVIAYNLNPPTMAVRGLLMDINASDYTDFTKPWWPERLIDTISFNNRVFFAVDNSSYGSIRNMACVMFRKDVAGECSIEPETLYNTVLENHWTLDKLEELIQGTYRDLNLDNQVNYGDRFGYATVDKPRLDAFFHGSGLTIVSKNSEGNYVMTLGDEKVQTVLERVNKFLFNNENVYMADDKMYAMFEGGQVLFYGTPIAVVDRKLDFEFGVLPTPKLNEDQESYITYMSNTHDSFCIPKTVRDFDMSAAIIEYMAYTAYTDVAPKYFEVMLKFKYSSDSATGQIYDMIRRNVIFDFGYIFSENFKQNPILLYRNMLVSGETGWAAKYKQFANIYQKDLQAIIDAMSNQ